MLAPLLLAATAGARSMTPLAAVSVSAARGDLSPQPGPLGLLSRKWAAAGLLALAAGELAGDKMRTAPNRTVVVGLAARTITGAVAAAAFEPRRKALAALLGAGVAIASSHLTFRGRMAALDRFGRTRSGLGEDILVVGLASAVIATAT